VIIVVASSDTIPYQLRLAEETKEKIRRLDVVEHNDLQNSGTRFLKGVMQALWKPAA
jgi:hypothetical protein